MSTDAVAARVMGFDPRRIRSVSWAPLVAEPYLGPSEPSGIEVRVSGAENLSVVSDGRRVVTPSMDPYPWKGQIEADDFAPPRVLRTKVAGTEVRAVLQDRSGVAFARLISEIGGQPSTVDLQLVAGDRQEGDCRAVLPTACLLRGHLTMEAGDALFNTHQEELDW